MTTKNPRINVTFDPEILNLLSSLAKQAHKSVAGLVRDLALESLESHEDFYLSKLAEKIDEDGSETYSHEEAWK